MKISWVLAFVCALFTLQIGQAAATEVAMDVGTTEDIYQPKSTYVSDQDYDLILEAYKHLDRRKWNTARGLIGRIEDQTARDLLTWHILTRSDTGATFDELLAFAERRDDWPKFDRLLVQAEKAIPGDMPPERIVAWFAGQEPLTSEGKVRLADSYFALGQEKFGRVWIERAWGDHDFSSKIEKQILRDHKKHISQDTHVRRMKRLLWHRQYSAARRLLPYVDKDTQALANARMNMLAGANTANRIRSSVPKKLRSDPGLLFDEIYAARRRGKDEETWPLLINGPTDVDLMVRPEKWWIERHLQARKAHKDGEYETAYQLAANNGMSRGADFAEAEFLAGWIALRYLNKPEKAYEHFVRLETGVSYPISKARSFYWQGRAAEAMGRTDKARIHFLSAGDFPYTYYGQLALVHPIIDAGTLILPRQLPIRDHLRWAFDIQENVKAIRLLAEFERKSDVRRFIYHYAENYHQSDEFALLAELALELDYPNYSVRVAKKANKRHIALIEYSYPVLEVPEYGGKGAPPDPALVFGLSRQESEFNPKAISSAGARGLMQLMPNTARITARKHGLIYNKAWLTEKPTYNTLLGMAHLSDLLERFDGSYIMTIAAYNAGALRSDQWNKAYGDPRKGEIDPIDWVESIPFKETRNYVQRVLENTQVYRNRLSGTDLPIGIVADLNRSNKSKTARAETDNQETLAGLGG